MQSYQPSRGRSIFQLLCAVGISAGLASAWMQTGATGLAAAAIIGALYSLVPVFDLFRRNPVAQVEPQRIDFDMPLDAEPESAEQKPGRDPAEPEPQRFSVDDRADERPVAQVVLVDPALPPVKESRPAKAARKVGNRRARAAKGTDSTDLLPVEVVAVEDRTNSDDMAWDPAPKPLEALPHPPAAPLFEPESFVRLQQRGTFGRKAS